MAIAEIRKAIRSVGDGRIGVTGHITRSGKSSTMIIYTAADAMMCFGKPNDISRYLFLSTS